jgi:ArsR family transcriptional regulator
MFFEDLLMYQESWERLSAKAEVFKALSHPSRVFIVERLLEREHCVHELAEMIGVEMPTISRHLSVLKNARIIACRKENNNVLYRMKCNCIKDTLLCVEMAEE